MNKRFIIGITLDGERMAVPIAESSLERLPAIFGSEPEWVEEMPESLRAGEVAAFIQRCIEKHWGEQAGGAA